VTPAAGPIVPATRESIAEAAALLRAGDLVAFPTETVYGLGADALSDRAVARVFAVKGRPRFNPLIVHVADADEAARLVALDERARRLANRFWPGPLTLVLSRLPGSGLSLLVSAGLDTVAVRAPDHPVAQALLRAGGRPIAAPSANVSGRISPTRAEDVQSELGDRVGLILDGGPCRIGIESTVLDLTVDPPALLRPGGIAADVLRDVLGPLGKSGEGAPRSPGMLPRHYAPSRPLRLNAVDARAGEALLGFGASAEPGGANLSTRADLAEAAANLFAMLRVLDRAPGVTAIAVAPIPEEDLGLAINDRLRRAAVPEDDWNDERGPAAPCVLPSDED